MITGMTATKKQSAKQMTPNNIEPKENILPVVDIECIFAAFNVLCELDLPLKLMRFSISLDWLIALILQ